MRVNWTGYWRSGQTESCFFAGAPADTAALWRAVFVALPMNARILDLACGAGALAKNAAGFSDRFRVTGLDYADELPDIPGVTMLSGAPLEALPFEAAVFDGVLSQYGFEYARVEDATEEAVRVLAPGGMLAFLTHADDSVPIQAARERLSRCRRLLASDGPVCAARSLGEAAAGGAALQPLADKAFSTLKRAAEGPQDETTRWALAFIGEILAKGMNFPPDYLIENSKTAHEVLTSYSDRLAAMSEAAMSREEIEGLAARFSTLGIESVTVEPAVIASDQIGWFLKGRRRA